MSNGGFGVGIGLAIAELLGGYDSDDGPLDFGDGYFHHGYYFGADGEIDYVYDDEEVVSVLPIFFRAAHGDRPTEEERAKIIELLKTR